jgi:hypothetical protein
MCNKLKNVKIVISVQMIAVMVYNTIIPRITCSNHFGSFSIKMTNLFEQKFEFLRWEINVGIVEENIIHC